MKKILLVLFLFAVSNLAVRAESFMQKAIDSWVGYSIDDVIDAWGFPTDEKEIAGRKLIYWKNNHYKVSGSYSDFSGGEYFCNRVFEVDKDNKILSARYRGNSCPLMYMTGKRYVNPKNNQWLKK